MFLVTKTPPSIQISKILFLSLTFKVSQQDLSGLDIWKRGSFQQVKWVIKASKHEIYVLLQHLRILSFAKNKISDIKSLWFSTILFSGNLLDLLPIVSGLLFIGLWLSVVSQIVHQGILCLSNISFILFEFRAVCLMLFRVLIDDTVFGELWQDWDLEWVDFSGVSRWGAEASSIQVWALALSGRGWLTCHSFIQIHFGFGLMGWVCGAVSVVSISGTGYGVSFLENN